MSVTFAGGTLVSDQPLNSHYGEYRLSKGTIEDEVYERDFPRSDGVLEVTSGNRRRVHVVTVTWMTTDEDAVDTTLDNLIKGKRYFTLTVGSKSFAYCRLMASPQVSDGRTGGYVGSNAVLCYTQRLIFKQVVV